MEQRVPDFLNIARILSAKWGELVSLLAFTTGYRLLVRQITQNTQPSTNPKCRSHQKLPLASGVSSQEQQTTAHCVADVIVSLKTKPRFTERLILRA